MSQDVGTLQFTSWRTQRTQREVISQVWVVNPASEYFLTSIEDSDSEVSYVIAQPCLEILLDLMTMSELWAELHRMDQEFDAVCQGLEFGIDLETPVSRFRAVAKRLLSSHRADRQVLAFRYDMIIGRRATVKKRIEQLQGNPNIGLAAHKVQGASRSTSISGIERLHHSNREGNTVTIEGEVPYTSRCRPNYHLHNQKSMLAQKVLRSMEDIFYEILPKIVFSAFHKGAFAALVYIDVLGSWINADTILKKWPAVIDELESRPKHLFEHWRIVGQSWSKFVGYTIENLPAAMNSILASGQQLRS
jgi:hypothetical protein